MAVKSKFVLRWEIDNPAVTLANRDAKSEVFNEGGFEWVACIEYRRYTLYDADFTLNCVNPRGGEWSCKTDMKGTLGGWTALERKNVKFNDGERFYKIRDVFAWDYLIDPLYGLVKDGKAVVEFHVNIIRSEGTEPPPMLDLSMLSSPTEAGNVTLLIGDKKLNVSKEYLAMHSPVFIAMFYSNFAEKSQKEVELKGVVYEEFIDLLQVICPDSVEITDRTVLPILKLADQFQMQGVMNQAEKFLIRSTQFENKLSVADRYRLTKLRDHYLQSFSTSQEMLQKLKSEAENFSDETKIAVHDRLFKF